MRRVIFTKRGRFFRSRARERILPSLRRSHLNSFFRRVWHSRTSLRVGRRGLALFLLIVGSAAAACYWTSGGQGITLNSLIDNAALWRNHPWAPAVVVAGYVLAGLAVVPVTLLIAVTGAAFGPVLGTFYAIAGVMASAAVAYGLGRVLARDVAARMSGTRFAEVMRSRARGGVLAVAAVRMVPLAPFTIVNLVFGALHVRAKVFLLGTLLGMGPGIVSIVVVVDRLEAAARRPGVDTIIWLVLALLLVALLAVFSARYAERFRAARARKR